jgi:hypothetical protein
MWQSTENTIKYIEDGVLEHLTKMLYLRSNWRQKVARIRMENSIGGSDALFLQLACLREKPKKIMEIGTWIGTSAYVLSQASDALIYTCDEGPDNFYIIEGQESYPDRIIRHPDTHSSEFLKKIDGGFDFVFVDGWLTDDDAKGIFKKCEDNFTFITHDYYRFEKPKPVFCKGYHAVERMIKYAWENEYECELYPPSPDWYSAGGYYVKKFGGMNTCCGMIKVSKNNG